jgi:hypothetical protein
LATKLVDPLWDFVACQCGVPERAETQKKRG